MMSKCVIITENDVTTISIPNSIAMKRRPTHPGEMLREDFLPDFGLTPAELATAIGVSRQSMYELLREPRGVSPEMTIRLARLFGNSSGFWLNAQRAVDLWKTFQAIQDEVKHITPLVPA